MDKPTLWCYTHHQEFVWARETCLGFDAMTLYGTVCNVRVKETEDEDASTEEGSE